MSFPVPNEYDMPEVKYNNGAVMTYPPGLSGDGTGVNLSQFEKEVILTLFSKAAYAEDNAGTAYDTLEDLWTTTTRTITYNLSHVSSSNPTENIKQGQSYTTELTATEGYTLNSVVITMSGVDITSEVYSSGMVTIPSVTGNIVITASAVLPVQSITATYTQSGTVYNTDSLDSLKSDLVVTANYSGGTSETVPASDYTLSGTLTVGTSTITVTYAGLTDTFSVTVTSNTGLYPLETGTTSFSDTNKSVSVSNGNIIHGINTSSSTGGDIHANISQVSLNSATANSQSNYATGTEKLFTIPSGASVTAIVTPLAISLTDAQIGSRSINITLRDHEGTILDKMLNTCPYSSLVVNTPVTYQFNASSDMNVWVVGMWMQGSNVRTADVQLDLKLFVNDVRYI